MKPQADGTHVARTWRACGAYVAGGLPCSSVYVYGYHGGGCARSEKLPPSFSFTHRRALLESPRRGLDVGRHAGLQGAQLYQV
jgi:hypothetical protein